MTLVASAKLQMALSKPAVVGYGDLDIAAQL